MIRNLFFLSLVLASGLVRGQDTIAYAVAPAYDFIKSEENEIHNSVSIAFFFEKLYQLKKTKNSTVNILQIGDSHIQADFLSSLLYLFHQEFHDFTLENSFYLSFCWKNE